MLPRTLPASTACQRQLVQVVAADQRQVQEDARAERDHRDQRQIDADPVSEPCQSAASSVFSRNPLAKISF